MTPGRSISFRHLFAGEIERFLRDNDLGFDGAVPALCELMILLSRYREEGTPLFPEVFLCDDREAAMEMLGGADAVRIGREALEADGVRRALKRAAPLGGAGWSVWLEVHGGSFEYGVFRTDPFVLQQTAMDRLRRTQGARGVLGVAQVEENVIELRSSSGAERYVYLSGARVDAEPGPRLVDRLVAHLGNELADDVRDGIRTFWRRVLVEQLRSSHGTLIAVVRSAGDVRGRFVDAAHLDPAIDVARHIRLYGEPHDESSRAAVQATASLVRGMLRADGITVLREDGSVVAYNAFVANRPSEKNLAAGGARRRTFDTLAAEVGDGLVAAFYRSQDGAAAVAP